MSTTPTAETKFKEYSWLTLAIDFGETFGLWKMIRKGVYIVAQKITMCPQKEMKTATKNGYGMFLLPRDRGISKELKIFKIHEPLATRILKTELREGLTVVDIGSNIGYYVILESKLTGKQGKVIAIEPIKRNFLCLLKNIETNDLNNVTAINVALSNQKGVVKMVSSVYSNKSHVLTNESADMLSIEKVTAMTGDELLKSTENIGLFRLDVEGYEDYVIEGCTETLKKWSPDILVEIHSPLLGRKRFRNLMCKFRDHGYTIKYIVPRSVDFPLVANDEDIATIDIDEILGKSFSDSTVWSYFTVFMRHSSQN
jgi:FkbM family methyltransferase